MEEAGVLFSIGPVEITGVILTSWIIIALLAVFSWLATRRLSDVPGPFQTAAELAVGGLQNYFKGIMGETLTKKYFSIFATFFIFIIVSNYSGVLPGAGHVKGFSVPSACLSVTAALGVIAFFTTHVIGVREAGAKYYFKQFLTFMLPLLIIEQFVRPFSLALRLYGNMYGEEMVTTQLYNLFPILLPLIMNVLSLLFCMIQAMVFTMLLSIYVSEGVEEGHNLRH